MAFLRALDRALALTNASLQSIVFIRDRNSKGHEISGSALSARLVHSLALRPPQSRAGGTVYTALPSRRSLWTPTDIRDAAVATLIARTACARRT